MNIGRAVRAGRWNEKKRTGQEKKSQKGYISPIWGEAPTEAICVKNCVVGDLLDVITNVPSFKVKFSGVTILQGVELSIFLLIFEWALQQCSATALPVIYFHSPGGSTWLKQRRLHVMLTFHSKFELRDMHMTAI